MVYQYAGKDGTETYNQYHSSSLIDKTLSDSEKLGPIDESSITPEWTEAQEQQSQKPADPNAKPPLDFIINLHDFEEAFTRFGSAKAKAYISGASNDLVTHHANKNYWAKLWFRPRIMRNVSTVSTTSRIHGVEVKMPVWIPPMGIAKTAGDEGEKALGAAAAKAGIVHCLSTASSFEIEEVLASAEGYPWFFQLYVDRDRKKSEALLKRLEGMQQVKAIWVTVDLPVVSKREADERIRVEGVRSAYAANGGEAQPSGQRNGGLARQTGSFIDPSFCWEDLAWLREHTSKPIVVKGVQGAADARKAAKMGCQGIVITNHGGRALDGAPASVAVLLELRRDCPEVFGKLEVHIDGGVRRGSDVLKAVLLGARSVGVGRPFQCSVMYGREGVEHCAGSKCICCKLRMGRANVSLQSCKMSWRPP